MNDEPTTEELRLDQVKRELAEARQAAGAELEDESEQHARRADKAAYLREQLEKRAEVERRDGSG